MHSEHNGRHTATPGQVVLRSAIHKGALSSGFVLLKGRLPLPATTGGDGPESRPTNRSLLLSSLLCFAGLPPPVLLPWNATVRAVKRSNSTYGHSGDMGLWQMRGTIVA